MKPDLFQRRTPRRGQPCGASRHWTPVGWLLFAVGLLGTAPGLWGLEPDAPEAGTPGTGVSEAEIAALFEQPATPPMCQVRTESRVPDQSPAAPGSVPVVLGSLRAAVDPKTGHLVRPLRRTLDLSRQSLEAFLVPHGELRERRIAAGGWKLGLQGRTLHPLLGTVDSDSAEPRVTVTHAVSPAVSYTVTENLRSEEPAAQADREADRETDQAPDQAAGATTPEDP